MAKKKKEKKYVTVQEGTDFRTIAKIMTAKGYKMNHATARNVLISAIKKILAHSADEVGVKISTEQMNALVKDQGLHSALADVLYRAKYPKEKQVNGDQEA